MKKKRTSVPQQISVEVLYASWETCCRCNERGKAIQIHHIDSNPSKHDLENLAVLCLECHNDTLLDGGFGRQLDAPLVKKYRDEWLKRVQKRREKADEVASGRCLKSTKDHQW